MRNPRLKATPAAPKGMYTVTRPDGRVVQAKLPKSKTGPKVLRGQEEAEAEAALTQAGIAITRRNLELMTEELARVKITLAVRGPERPPGKPPADGRKPRGVNLASPLEYTDEDSSETETDGSDVESDPAPQPRRSNARRVR